MESTVVVEKVLYDMYLKSFGHPIDEIKMHKLMYFAQRESLIVQGVALFREEFHGWKYGPVLYTVCSEFTKEHPFSTIPETVTEKTADILNAVLTRYGSMSSWALSVMSHGEMSWKMARKGLAANDHGTTVLLLDAIKLDAMRESTLRRAKSTLLTPLQMDVKNPIL